MLNRFVSLFSANLAHIKANSFKQDLKAKYKDHKVVSYAATRILMYNTVDCEDNKLYLIYGGVPYNWKCGQNKNPPLDDINAEHTVPQSFFNKLQPMVSDLHHLISAPHTLNEARSNYKFAEFDYSKCQKFCHGLTCQTSHPSNPDDYSCLSNDNQWMPRKADRGQVARMVLYFFTMYDDYDISRVGDLKTFLKWNSQYAPSDHEITRNNVLNRTQGNRNPYIDHPEWANQAFA